MVLMARSVWLWLEVLDRIPAGPNVCRRDYVYTMLQTCQRYGVCNFAFQEPFDSVGNIPDYRTSRLSILP